MSTPDTFADIARYYDAMMSHVDYDHWAHVALTLRAALPTPFTHLDAACGTGVLMESLRRVGWNSVGIDLSTAMLRSAHKRRRSLPLATADLVALPFGDRFELVTCLFDSLNFLLDDAVFEAGIQSLARVLRDGGVLYFDVVTERMVTEFFEGPGWTEEEDGLRSAWKTLYDRETRIANTSVRINTGPEGVIRERIYDLKHIQNVVEKAGLEVLAVVDADNWKKPGKRTTRVDFVACKRPGTRMRARMMDAIEHLRLTR